MKRFVIFLIVVLLLGSAGYGALRWKSSEKKTEVTRKWSPAEVKDVSVTVETTGIVQSNLDVEIKAKASGEIVKLPYDVSDSVKAGDLLAELDPVDEERSARQAEMATSSTLARLQQARLNLDIARQTLKTNRERAKTSLDSAEATAHDSRQKSQRIKGLMDRQLASTQDYEDAVATAASAESALEGARIRLDELKTEELDIENDKLAITQAQIDYENSMVSLENARQRLTETRIFSPIDGVISELSVQKGQIISSAISNVGGGTTMMIVSDLSRIYVVASVDESDIGRVKKDQATRITVDAYPGVTFDGIVRQIAVKGVSTSNVVTFDVKIEVTSTNKARLKPQMTANVSIVVEEHLGVLTVPVECVGREKRESFVEVRGLGDVAEKRTVEVGLSDGTSTEIVSGLKEGEEVAVQNSVSSKWQAGQNGGSTRRSGPPMMRPF